MIFESHVSGNICQTLSRCSSGSELLGPKLGTSSILLSLILALIISDYIPSSTSLTFVQPIYWFLSTWCFYIDLLLSSLIRMEWLFLNMWIYSFFFSIFCLSHINVEEFFVNANILILSKSTSSLGFYFISDITLLSTVKFVHIFI